MLTLREELLQHLPNRDRLPLWQQQERYRVSVLMAIDTTDKVPVTADLLSTHEVKIP